MSRTEAWFCKKCGILGAPCEHLTHTGYPLPDLPAAQAEPPICPKCGRHGVLSEAGLLWVSDHGRVDWQERGIPADQVDWRECSNRHLANFKVMMAERDALEAQNRALREALTSIANNSCCTGCQEAKLVARAALATPGIAKEE